MRLRLTAAALATAVLALPASVAASTPVTQHLTDGGQLVDNLARTAWPAQATINKYDADDANTGITWGTPGLAAGWSNDTRCARLVNDLLRHAYGWATDTWFQAQFNQSVSPDTAKWVTANKGNPTHLDPVTTVAALQAGDILMIDKSTGTDHTAIVRQVTPLPGGMTPQSGTTQYAVQVLDSTSNPHGWLINGTNHAYSQWADTRRLDGAGTSVTEYNGAGYGWMVLYANDADGKIYGWRWGVNESAIDKVSDGHTVLFARVTDEA